MNHDLPRQGNPLPIPQAENALEVRSPMRQREMCASGASRIIIHCGDYKCGHSVTMYPALRPDNVRLSELEDRFVCTVRGHRGADVRPGRHRHRCLSKRPHRGKIATFGIAAIVGRRIEASGSRPNITVALS